MADVLEEHYSYLSLSGRADRFARAIEQVLPAGATVADLGCGFGVLGLQCLQAGASCVWGIDQTGAIEIARESARRAGFAERYHCIGASTFDCELPEQVDLIVCDHVGFFGIDYGIVGMMADARRRLLKPGGAVMPRSLDLYVAGLSSDACRKRVECWTADPIPTEYHWLRGHAANSKLPCHVDAADLCTPPAKVGHVPLDADQPGTFVVTVELRADKECRFDGLAGWFDCELAEGVRMTNSPVAGQRLDRPNAFFPVAEPFAVQAGEIVGVSLHADHEANLYTWTVVQPDGTRQRQSTWRSRILGSEDLVAESSRPQGLSVKGRAQARVLELVDGHRSVRDIEDAVIGEFPRLHRDVELTRSFVRQTIARATR